MTIGRKPKAKRKGRARVLPVLHADAAGIDIGAEEVFVAVPPDRSTESVQSFATFTRDLYALADWLQSCRIRSVAMESTGVYWIPLFQILETREFEVFLVNAQHVKNVPGRKSDVSRSRTELPSPSDLEHNASTTRETISENTTER